MLVSDFLLRNARRRPDVPAVVFRGRSVSWAALEARVNRLGHAMRALGVMPGTPVAILLGNSIEMIEAHFALCRIGAIAVPIMPRSVDLEIAHIVNDVGARVLISAEPVSDALRGAMKTVQAVVDVGAKTGGDFAYEDLLGRAPADYVDVAFDHASVGGIKYTSGTTGKPKGCARNHDRRALAALTFMAHAPYHETDRCTISSPLAAGFALSLMDAMVCGGATLFMLPKYDTHELLETIAREKATIAYAIMSTFNQFTRADGLDGYDLSSLRLFNGTSATQDTMLGLKRLRRHPSFRAGFINAYGSSEAGGSVTYNMPEDIEAAINDPALAPRVESVGREAYGCRIECLGDDMRPVPAGEVGEMAIRAPTVFAGYWNMPEQTAEVFRDGWLVTGDMAFKDKDGFVFLAGRKRDMIKTGGINVYPAEIEYILAAHPKIAEVAVVGVPDEQWGEKVIACAVTREPCTQDEIIGFCTDKLAGYKKPKEVRFLPDLPKNETGKIVKRELRDQILAADKNGARA